MPWPEHKAALYRLDTAACHVVPLSGRNCDYFFSSDEFTTPLAILVRVGSSEKRLPVPVGHAFARLLKLLPSEFFDSS